MKMYHVYIMASRSRALYTGMASDLGRRVEQHRTGRGSKHASRYRINRLVYVESYNHVLDAIARETQIKSWRREKKIALIESINPDWLDLEVPPEGIFFMRA